MSQVTLAGNPVDVAGLFPAVGEMAQPFSLVAKDLADVALEDFAGQRKVLNIFPSVDTGVCATSVRTFNAEASKLESEINQMVGVVTNGLFARRRADVVIVGGEPPVVL